MKELKIDLSAALPKSVDQFLQEAFDYVITVCDDAKETCPVFVGKVKHRVHMGFADPAAATGTEAEIMDVFRRVRDEVRERFFTFYSEQIKPTPKT
jgi:arsenate reductase